MTSKNELNNWWENLPSETQFKYAEKLEEHLAECAIIYFKHCSNFPICILLTN